MLLDAVFLLLAVGILIMIYKIKFSKPNDNQIPIATAQQQRQVHNDRPDEQNEQPAWTGQEQSLSQSQTQQKDGPVDRRKQMHKQRKKRQKDQRNRARQQMLDEENKKRDQYDKEQQELEQAQEEKKKKEQQYYAQIAAQEQKKKDEQFNKWKGMFVVEASGKQKDTPQEEQKKVKEFEDKFLSTLQKNKLSLLEDLSHSFGLSTKEVIEKIKEFQKRGIVDGIFDQRGKYLVIEQIQWQTIKNYIQAKGRVKKTDIMTECARIIKIPDNVYQEDLDKLIQTESKGFD